MRWMLKCDCADWDWEVLTLGYQLSFPTSMYEQHYIDSVIDPQPNELVVNSWDSNWLTGQGTLLPLMLWVG